MQQIKNNPSNHKKPPRTHQRPHHYITQEVKQGVYYHTLANVQAGLTPTQRLLSRIVHSRFVEPAMELLEPLFMHKTVLLAGPLTMATGTIVGVAIGAYYNITMPASLPLALFFAGSIIGFIVSLLGRVLKSRR